jgi:hypothetical protein
MAEVRVQLPLGAFYQRRIGKLGNPPASGAGDRQFKSDCGDYFAVGPVLVQADAC